MRNRQVPGACPAIAQVCEEQGEDRVAGAGEEEVYEQKTAAGEKMAASGGNDDKIKVRRVEVVDGKREG